MAKVSNEKKLEAVKIWLTENGIEFKENHVTRNGLEIALWVPKLFIAVHVSDGDDAVFYKKTFKWCHPFFIRSSETKDFVLEKLQNCCYQQMIFLQRRFERENSKK